MLKSKCAGEIDAKNWLFSKDVYFTWISRKLIFISSINALLIQNKQGDDY